MKVNCWEVKNCKRQSSMLKIAESGICPAASPKAPHKGKNGGENAGRYCWKVAGTLCGGHIQGEFAHSLIDCTLCDFYKRVKKEEGDNFVK